MMLERAGAKSAFNSVLNGWNGPYHVPDFSLKHRFPRKRAKSVSKDFLNVASSETRTNLEEAIRWCEMWPIV